MKIKKNIVSNIVLNEFINDARVLKTSKTLSHAGYTVSVIAIHKPGLIMKEYNHYFVIDRIKLFSRPWPKYKPIQFLKYFEFIVRVLCSYRKSDICHCNDLHALPVGVLIKLLGQDVKVIYDCHEHETELNNLNGLEKKLKKVFESILIRFADEVITVSNSIAIDYQRLYNLSKPHLVLNCPVYREQDKKNLFREKLPIRDDQTIFLYQGGLSKGRGIELLLEAFSNLDTDKNVLACMGYGPLEALVKEKADNSSTIFFHPAVPPSILINYTSSADFGILFYEDTCLNHRYCAPNKMFEYLMAGLPVLTSNLYEMKRLVETERVGVVAEKNTVQGFKKAVEASLKQDYQSIQQNVFKARKKYCWEEQEKVLNKIYS